MITIVKVVSRNFIADWWSGVLNLVGSNLTPYEKMAEKAQKQISEEITKRNVKLAWYRYEITQLGNGGLMMMLYGDEK